MLIKILYIRVLLMSKDGGPGGYTTHIKCINLVIISYGMCQWARNIISWHEILFRGHEKKSDGPKPATDVGLLCGLLPVVWIL